MRLLPLITATSVTLVCHSLLALDVVQQSWTRFRGPNGTGTVSGPVFPANWTTQDFAWQTDLPGTGHSSPVIWQETLYVTSAGRQSGDVTLYALNVADGAEQWSLSFDMQPYHTHPINTFASCTPAVDEKHVYVSLATPEEVLLVATDHAGHEVWRQSLGTFESNHGAGNSPIVYDDLVIQACDHEGDSFVVALDANSGEPRWKTQRRSGIASYAAPCVWTSSTGQSQVIVDSTAEGMAGLSLADGKPVWQLPQVFPQRCVSSPLSAGDYVLASSGAGSNGHSLVCVRPSPAPDSAAEIVYEIRKSVPQVPTPVVSGDLLIILHDRGTASCRDLATGEEHWIKRIGGSYFASPVCVGGRVFCVGDDGTVVVFAAEKEFRELGRGELPGRSFATPAIDGKRMFFRSESNVACLLAG